MDYINPDAMVETGWLADHLDDSDVAILDASFHLPAANRDAQAEFAAAHIAGAVFFDIDDISDKNVNLPHMMPTPEIFGEKVGALGVSPDDHVIVYDANGGAMAAMRVWWMFRVYGHQRVSVLNGGLPKWLAEERAVTNQPSPVEPKIYTAGGLNSALVRSIEQVQNNIPLNAEQVIDARSAGRFDATEPEPRAGMRSGHIPGSLNLPFQQLVYTDEHLTIRSADELSKAIGDAGIDPEAPIVSSCGSGVTAAVLVYSLYLLGYEHAAIYDGSWTEWGGRDDTPIDT